MTISLKVSRLPRYYTSRTADFQMSSCMSSSYAACLYFVIGSLLLFSILKHSLALFNMWFATLSTVSSWSKLVNGRQTTLDQQKNTWSYQLKVCLVCATWWQVNQLMFILQQGEASYLFHYHVNMDFHGKYLKRHTHISFFA